ncbi:hypothetical protein PM082_015188 [Marasmius tenuissimus]|nr:hypothetical protein PM082_015188 [Marasmius tenuissimus]
MTSKNKIPTEPTTSRVEKWLDDKVNEDSVPCEIAAKARTVFTLLCVLVSDMEQRGWDAPFKGPKFIAIEFMMASYMIYLYGDELTMKQLSEGVRRLREHARGNHADLRLNSETYKDLVKFVRNQVKKCVGNVAPDGDPELDVPAFEYSKRNEEKILEKMGNESTETKAVVKAEPQGPKPSKAKAKANRDEDVEMELEEGELPTPKKPRTKRKLVAEVGTSVETVSAPVKIEKTAAPRKRTRVEDAEDPVSEKPAKQRIRASEPGPPTSSSSNTVPTPSTIKAEKMPATSTPDAQAPAQRQIVNSASTPSAPLTTPASAPPKRSGVKKPVSPFLPTPKTFKASAKQTTAARRASSSSNTPHVSPEPTPTPLAPVTTSTASSSAPLVGWPGQSQCSPPLQNPSVDYLSYPATQTTAESFSSSSIPRNSPLIQSQVPSGVPSGTKQEERERLGGIRRLRNESTSPMNVQAPAPAPAPPVGVAPSRDPRILQKQKQAAASASNSPAITHSTPSWADTLSYAQGGIIPLGSTTRPGSTAQPGPNHNRSYRPQADSGSGSLPSPAHTPIISTTPTTLPIFLRGQTEPFRSAQTAVRDSIGESVPPLTAPAVLMTPSTGSSVFAPSSLPTSLAPTASPVQPDTVISPPTSISTPCFSVPSTSSSDIPVGRRTSSASTSTSNNHPIETVPSASIAPASAGLPARPEFSAFSGTLPTRATVIISLLLLSHQLIDPLPVGLGQEVEDVGEAGQPTVIAPIPAVITIEDIGVGQVISPRTFQLNVDVDANRRATELARLGVMGRTAEHATR